MSIWVLLAVLFAAFLHAGWNAIIKGGVNAHASMAILAVGHALIGLALIGAHEWPVAQVWPWLAASACIHAAYQLFLSLAYEQGDLSRVYPIARGTAPLIVLVVSALFLADPLSVAEIAGIVTLGLGIALLAWGVIGQGESRRLLPFAFGSALATAGYTLADGLGARVWGQPLAYVAWLMVLSGVIYLPLIMAWKGRSVLAAGGRAWVMGLAAAAASFLAYAIIVWAMTRAPIALVGALRETSVLFALLLGWRLFGERLDAGKLVAAGLIMLGVAVTRL